MANPENVPETGQPDPASDHDRSFVIQATPDPESGVIFQKAPDGGVSISFQGQITIDLPKALADVTGAAISAPPDAGYRLISDGTLLPDEAAPAVSRQEQRQEREIITKHITFTKAPESIISPSERQANGLNQTALPSLSAALTKRLTCPPVKLTGPRSLYHSR